MLRKTLLKFALTCAAGVALLATASAQVTQVPGTGCANAPYPHASGPAVIGQRFAVRCPPCRDNQAGFVILGLSIHPGLALHPPITCTREPCVLGCRPIDVQFADGWSVAIPADRHLVGACICLQCGCLDRAHACLTLSGALRICVEAPG